MLSFAAAAPEPGLLVALESPPPFALLILNRDLKATYLPMRVRSAPVDRLPGELLGVSAFRLAADVGIAPGCVCTGLAGQPFSR